MKHLGGLFLTVLFCLTGPYFFTNHANALLIYIDDGAVHSIDESNSFPFDRLIVGEREEGGAGIQPTIVNVLSGGVVDNVTVTYSSIANLQGGIVVHPIKAYFVSCSARIFSLKNSRSLKP